MKCDVYVPWGWRIRPMGVAYTSKGAKVAYKSKGPNNELKNETIQSMLVLVLSCTINS